MGKLQTMQDFIDNICKQEKSGKRICWAIVGVIALWALFVVMTVGKLWTRAAERTPLDLILVIFIIALFSVMMFLGINALRKRLAETDLEAKRWRTKLLDAYNGLLEADVKIEKEKMIKQMKNSDFEKNKEEKQNELELKRIEIEQKKIDIELMELDLKMKQLDKIKANNHVCDQPTD